MRKLTYNLLALSLIFICSSCEHLRDYLDEVEPTRPAISDFATGLSSPLGLEMDSYHRLWVTEAGTGMNDGHVSVITPSGQVYNAIEGFVSDVDPEGNPSGLNHLLYDNGTLWILHGVEGRLYRANVGHFVPGSTPPLQASQLEYYEIGDFVLEQGYHESNLYSLTEGPDGDLYLVDSGANAIIRRDAQSGELSVFAEFPSIPNPTQVGPPLIDPVPTGIVFDEDRFLVTTLTGFPFLEGLAKVYEVDLAGQTSVYQDGLTTLVDIEMAHDNKPLVLQFSEFGQTGWVPGTGKIIQVTEEQNKVLRTGLSFATDMELVGQRTAYVSNLAEGKIVRVAY